MITEATDKQLAEADALAAQFLMMNGRIDIGFDEATDSTFLALIVERDYLVDQLLQAARRERELRYDMECMEISIGKEL